MMVTMFVQKVITVLVITAVAIIALHAVLLDHREATCWTPAQFMPGHIQYSNNYCGRAETYYPYQDPSDELPPSGLRPVPKQKMNITPSFNRHLSIEVLVVLLYLVLSHQVLSLTKPNYSMLVSLYPGSSSTKSPHCQKGEDAPQEGSRRSKHLMKLMSSFGIAVLYIIVQLSFVIAMFVICSDFRSRFPALREEVAINCDMEIRHQARVHQYLLQCNLPCQAPYGKLRDLNIAVCVFGGIITLLHLVHVFLIAPWWYRSVLQVTLSDQKVIKSPQQVGFSFILSDLYMSSRSACAAVSHGGELRTPSPTGGPEAREMKDLSSYQPTSGVPEEEVLYPQL